MASFLKKYSKYIVVALVVFVALFLRHFLLPLETYDYTTFLSKWYDQVHQYGFQGLRDSFANYNAPYLYLLWIVSNLPIDKLVGIKLITIFFDLVLAVVIYLFIRSFRKDGNYALYGALGSLFLPTVLLNGAFWGQCDTIYTSFALLSLLYAYKQKQLLSWGFFGAAIAFKLQAIFVLPALAYFWLVQKDKDKSQLFAPALAPVVLFLSILPTLVIGKPLSEVVLMYQGLTQAQLLTANAASLYQWIPGSMYSFFNNFGVILTGTIVSLILWLTFSTIHKKGKLSGKELFVFPLVLTMIIPFFLPQMHDRYYFIAEILAYIIAFVVGGRWIIVAIVLQATAFLAYYPFLFNYQLVYLGVVSLVQLALIGYLLYRMFDHIFEKHRKTGEKLFSI